MRAEEGDTEGGNPGGNTRETDEQNGCPYVIGPAPVNARDCARFEFKASSPNQTGGGYARWRSTERLEDTPGRSAERYVAVHRLLAVVACYDLDRPIEEVLADLRRKDVHHKLGMPSANIPEEIELLTHSEHASISSEERRAWAEDEKRNRDRELPADDGVCENCGVERPPLATSPAFDGRWCLPCATEAAAETDHAINL